MTARGMAAHIESVRIAAEARGILINPGDGAAYLVRHHAQVAIGGLDGDEIEHDEI